MRQEKTEHNSGFAKLLQHSEASVLEINKSSCKSYDVLVSFAVAEAVIGNCFLRWWALLSISFCYLAIQLAFEEEKNQTNKQTNKKDVTWMHIFLVVISHGHPAGNHWICWTIMLFNCPWACRDNNVYAVFISCPFLLVVHFVNCRIFCKKCVAFWFWKDQRQKWQSILLVFLFNIQTFLLMHGLSTSLQLLWS